MKKKKRGNSYLRMSFLRPVLLLLGIGVLFSGSLLSGCGTKEKESGSDDSQNKEIEGISDEDESSGSAVDDLGELSNYVTLGQYKGLEYTEADLEVSEEELQEAINAYMEEKSKVQVMDRAVENGDTINLDFAGYLDGEAFEGGTSEGYQLQIGSGAMIPGFEEGIVGMMPGESASIDVTFPETYRPEGIPGSEMNGKAVVFDITVNYIIGTTELNYDENFIENYTDFETKEAFEEDLKTDILEEKQEEAESNRRDELFDKLIANAEIHELPETEVKKYHDNLVESYQSMADSIGMELSDFLAQYYGVTEEDLEEYANEYAELMATQAVVFQSVAEKEGISISEEEYQEGLDSYYEMMGNTYESRESFEEEMGELLREALLYEKVEQFIVEQAVAVSE